MRKLNKLLSLTAFIGLFSFAQTKRVETISDVQGINNLENLMPNPGFDKNSNGMTATGFTASSATSSTNLGRNQRSLVVDMDTTGDLIETANMTIPNYMKGQNGVAFCRFRNPGTTGGSTTDYQLRVTDGTNNLSDVSTTNLIPLSTNFERHSQSFIFPTSGSVRLQIRAQSATVAEMAIDDCYLGLADNISQISQASLYGTLSYAGATNCIWSINQATLAAGFSADTDCATPTVTEFASAPGTKIPQINFTVLPPGKYVVETTEFVLDTTDTNFNACQLFDASGTNIGGMSNTTADGLVRLSGVVTYQTAQSSANFHVRCANPTPAIINLPNASSLGSFGFTVRKFPLTSEITLRPDVQNQFASISFAGAASCSWDSTSGSYVDLASDSDCPTPTVRGIGVADTKRPSLGVPGLKPGVYMVTAVGSFFTDESSSGNSQCAWRISDGTNTSASMFQTNVVSKGRMHGSTLVGIFNYTATQGALNFRIQNIRPNGNQTCSIQNSDTAGINGFEMSLIPLSNNLQNPILVGSVSSNSTGQERIERAKINCDAASSIISQSGSWLSAIGNRSTAACTITIASGIFSAEPVCVMTIEAATVQATSVDMTSATAGTVYGASADYDANLICMGPR